MTDAPRTSPIHLFISYSQASPAHGRRVRDLADRLRSHAIAAEIDRYEGLKGPAISWTARMQKQMRDARYVLVVCTEAYFRRASGTERPGVGKGAIWESREITQAIYDASGHNERFIPIVFARDDSASSPSSCGRTSVTTCRPMKGTRASTGT